jgi:hypothetical protein
MIIGRSKIRKNRIYVDVATPQVLSEAKERGWEVVEIGRPAYLALKTNVGVCSGPTMYSARHCFGGPLTEVKGRTYEVIAYGVEGRVVKDYSPPIKNLVALIANFFGFSVGVRDVVRVSAPYWPSDGQVAVVSAAPPDRPVGLFAPVPGYKPHEVVGKDVVAMVDVPEPAEIQCTVTDYTTVYVFVDDFPWPHDVYIATCKKMLRPGNSGGPVYLRQ